jgi:hypothetical protein
MVQICQEHFCFLVFFVVFLLFLFFFSIIFSKLDSNISLSLKDLLTSNRFYPFRWINQSSYLVGVREIHFRFHGFNLFVKINIRYYIHIVGKFINYEQLVIINFHKKLISQWCMTCPTNSIEFICFYSFMLNIKCYSLGLWFHLNVCLWFLNFFKFYFSLTASLKNIFFYRNVVYFETNTLCSMG